MEYNGINSTHWEQSYEPEGPLIIADFAVLAFLVLIGSSVWVRRLYRKWRRVLQPVDAVYV